MKFGLEVDGAQRMNPTNFGHAITFPLANQTLLLNLYYLNY